MIAEPASRIPYESPLAIYANCCEVGYNAFEFLLDFGQFRPEHGAIHVHSRIVTGPVQAKLFARMLSDAVARHETEHGPIPDIDGDDAMEALLTSAPEFERRALNARRAPRPAPDLRAPEATPAAPDPER
jgi:hypothetical protein